MDGVVKDAVVLLLDGTSKISAAAATLMAELDASIKSGMIDEPIVDQPGLDEFASS